jgi:hypothetical protein
VGKGEQDERESAYADLADRYGDLAGAAADGAEPDGDDEDEDE